MLQSNRLRWHIEYYNHPLRKEYEKKKEKVRKKKLNCAPEAILFNIVRLIPFGLFFFYGAWFFKGWDLVDEPNFDFLFNIIGGLINIRILISALVSFFENNSTPVLVETDDYTKLKEEYFEKGLYEVNEYELWEHSCCDECDGDYYCCVTKRPIYSNEEIRWCSQHGNCKKCKTFVRAYLSGIHPDFEEDSLNYWPGGFEK